jgi:cobalt/nickel transport system permease protein
MYLIYRYLFILLETHQNMAHASPPALGTAMAHIPCTMLKNAFRLLFVSLRQTSDMLLAMESRCYDWEIRFLHRTYRPCAKQILLSAAAVTALFSSGSAAGRDIIGNALVKA